MGLAAQTLMILLLGRLAFGIGTKRLCLGHPFTFSKTLQVCADLANNVNHV